MLIRRIKHRLARQLLVGLTVGSILGTSFGSLEAANQTLQHLSIVVDDGWKREPWSAVIAFVQQSATADGSANLTITTTATTNPVTAGNCLVAVIESLSGNATTPEFASSISDNGANTWPASAAITKGDNNGSGRSCEIWVLPNAKAKSGYTLTVTYPTATTETRVTVIEFSGVATSSPVDVTGSAATPAAGGNVLTLAVSTSSAITNGNDLLVTNLSAATGQASSGITVPTGTTQIEIDQNDATSIGCGSAFQVLSGASGVQTKTWNWTTGSTNSTCACIVALLPAGAAAALLPGLPIARVPSTPPASNSYQTFPGKLASPVFVASIPRNPVIDPAYRRDTQWSLRDFQVLPRDRVLPSIQPPGPLPFTQLLDPAYRRDIWVPQLAQPGAPPPAAALIPFAPLPQVNRESWRDDQYQELGETLPLGAAPSGPLPVPKVLQYWPLVWSPNQYQSVMPDVLPAPAPGPLPQPTLLQFWAINWRADQYQVILPDVLPSTQPPGPLPYVNLLDPAYRRDPWPLQLAPPFVPPSAVTPLIYATLPQISWASWSLGQYQQPTNFTIPPVSPPGYLGPQPLPDATRRDAWVGQVIQPLVPPPASGFLPFLPPVQLLSVSWRADQFQTFNNPLTGTAQPGPLPIRQIPLGSEGRRDMYWSLLNYWVFSPNIPPPPFVAPTGLHEIGLGFSLIRLGGRVGAN